MWAGIVLLPEMYIVATNCKQVGRIRGSMIYFLLLWSLMANKIFHLFVADRDRKELS